MIPNHIAIIMDGNGRWAKANDVLKLEGHKKGAAKAKEIIKHAAKIGIKHLTLYAFSFENWKRPAQEVLDIVGILNFYLKNQIEELHKNNIRFQMIGDRSKMGSDLQKLVANAENLTKNNDLMNVYLAFSYGGRDEIIRACNKAMQDGESEISEENFAKYLDVSSMPDVDLMIRTSGEIRISNFLIWQSAYSELYFNDKLWPDFTPNDLDDAIEDFNLRERNFGYAREQKTS